MILSSNITLMVSDLDTAIHFYTNTLDFKLKNRYGNHWADIEAPGLSIGLHPAHPYVRYGDTMTIGLKVANLAEAIAYYKSRGIEFNELEDSKVALASFNDPSGNGLYLIADQS